VTITNIISMTMSMTLTVS